MDRISQLPGHILSHIMSFLGTREAARLSALASGWRRLWTDVPHLALDAGDDLGGADWRRLVHIVERLWRLRGCCEAGAAVRIISALHLSYCWRLHGGVIHDGRPAGLPNFDELHVLLEDEFGRYTSRHDESFKALCLKNLDLAELGFLNLEKLSVTGIVFDINMTCTSHCSASLTELALYECNFVGSIHICHPLLKNLYFMGCRGQHFDLAVEAASLETLYVEVSSVREVKLEAPRLRRFCWLRGTADKVTAGEMAELAEAEVIMPAGAPRRSNAKLLEALLRAMSCTAQLDLDSHCIETLQTVKDLDLLPFARLNQMKISARIYPESIYVLSHLLPKFPFLETLSLNSDWSISTYPDSSTSHDLGVGWLRRLGTVTITGCLPSIDETELIAYLLKKATVLKKIVIKQLYHKQSQCEFKNSLLRLPRASKDVHIVVN